MQTVSEFVTTNRTKMNLTQNQVASLSGVSVTTVKRLEEGSQQPSLDTLTKVLTALRKNAKRA